jgi:ubiquinone/menaquinone biosynthesis C-methylase UbiE
VLDYFQDRTRSALLDYKQIQPWVHFEDSAVLDLGCGSGGKSVFWASLGARKVVGVDLAASVLAASELVQKSPTTWAQPMFIQADGGTLPIIDEGFDTIIVHDVLEHLSEPHKVLRECYRVLRPCGRLSILAPHYHGLSGNHLWNYLDGSLWRYIHPHLILPRPILRRIVMIVGRQRHYSAQQIEFEWNQFLTLNRLTPTQIRKSLDIFQVEHFQLRLPENSTVRRVSQLLGLTDLFSYGVVAIATKPARPRH